MSKNIIRPSEGRLQMEITPESADWRFLSFSIIQLAAGEQEQIRVDGQETAIVPLSGAVTVAVAGQEWPLARTSVFEQMPHVGYVPPGVEAIITAGPEGAEFAYGSAAAEGKYPARLFEPQEMKSEVRGGGAAHRQVNHILAPPLPAERLILYEVYVPRGTWSGWAPHRHDGVDGAPYLEETYYFRLNPGNGFAMHRNWAPEADFDETLLLHDGDCALVPLGYHSSVACPSSHMFFLNFLAGELVDEERTTPPCFHPDHTWIQDDWDAGAWSLPQVTP